MWSVMGYCSYDFHDSRSVIMFAVQSGDCWGVKSKGSAEEETVIKGLCEKDKNKKV
jgi:hypothetical protein